MTGPRSPRRASTRTLLTKWVTGMIELRCSRDLALKLGAVIPGAIKHDRELRDAGHLIVRDKQTGWAMFWPWQLTPAAAARE
jgi:hypothetical protein